jgi:hypothetical protein
MAKVQKPREYLRYEFRRPDDTIIRTGITRRPLPQRETELRREGSRRGTTHQVGPIVTEVTARAGQKEQSTSAPIDVQALRTELRSCVAAEMERHLRVCPTCGASIRTSKLQIFTLVARLESAGRRTRFRRGGPALGTRRLANGFDAAKRTAPDSLGLSPCTPREHAIALGEPSAACSPIARFFWGGTPGRRTIRHTTRGRVVRSGGARS